MMMEETINKARDLGMSKDTSQMLKEGLQKTKEVKNKVMDTYEQAKSALKTNVIDYADMGREKLYSKYEDLKDELKSQPLFQRYGYMSIVAGLFFGGFLLLTSPIWLTLLFFNLPWMIPMYFLFFYTKVLSFIHCSLSYVLL